MNSNRLAATTSIGAVHLQVSDLQRSLSFYRDLLGFRVIRSEGLDAWLSATGEEPDLIRLTELAGAGRPPPRATGLFHVAYRAPGRAALGRRLHRLLDTKTRFKAPATTASARPSTWPTPMAWVSSATAIALATAGRFAANMSPWSPSTSTRPTCSPRAKAGGGTVPIRPATSAMYICAYRAWRGPSRSTSTPSGSTSCSATSRGPVPRCRGLPPPPGRQHLAFR